MFVQGSEGDQNVPPQNMPLRHEDYFKLKAIEKQQIQKKLSIHHHPICLKAGHKFPFVNVFPTSLSYQEGQNKFQSPDMTLNFSAQRCHPHITNFTKNNPYVPLVFTFPQLTT